MSVESKGVIGTTDVPGLSRIGIAGKEVSFEELPLVFGFGGRVGTDDDLDSLTV